MATMKGLLVAGMIVLGVSWVLPARAETNQDPGKVLYRKYCAACHGSDGKGNGVVATVLRPKPSDLTQMAKKNEGRFPFYETVRVIDGRTTVRAHGDADMPVWGEIFSAEAGNYSLTQRAESSGRIMLITEYLATIQQK
jgi:mono/diheme cytochrome c family protein